MSHTDAGILCNILLYSAYDRVRYVSIEVKSVYFCAPHLKSNAEVKGRLTVNRISLKKCCTSARSTPVCLADTHRQTLQMILTATGSRPTAEHAVARGAQAP